MATSDQLSAYYKASDWLSDGTLKSLDYFRNLNAGNDSASAAINDLYYNAASADLQTRSDVNYAKQMIPLSLDLQRGQQEIASAADLQRLGAEGAIVRDLVDMQGRYTLEGQKLETEADKYGYDRALEGSKYTADKNLEGNKYVSDRKLEGDKYVSDNDTTWRIYAADREEAWRKYTSDRELEGTKYGYDSQERQIGLTGLEQRKTMTHETNQTMRLRADARGAISAAGKRFYG